MFATFAQASPRIDAQLLAPNSAVFEYTDHSGVTVSGSMARFERPISDGQGYEHCTPGARIRFRTDASNLIIRLAYNALVIRPDARNMVGAILVDGTLKQTFTSPYPLGSPCNHRVNVVHASSAMRLHEIVLPYGDGVDFFGVELPPNASATAPTPRVGMRLVAFGDSITHGFNASDISKSWPFLLAQARNWPLINLGYGGRQCVQGDGTVAGQQAPNVATYLIGYNDFAGQRPLSTFKAEYKATVQNFRAASPEAQLYCITPLWSPNTDAIPLEGYREQIRAALAELADPLCTLVEGPALATGDVEHFPDNVHPNDTASAQIASALATLMA